MKTDVALLDVDGTVFSKRSIDVLCERFGFAPELKRIDLEFRNTPRYVVTQKIAALFSGKKRNDLEKIFDTIPLNEGVYPFVSFLKDRGFVIALATDGYKFLADRLKERLQLDLAYGNALQFNGDSLTGNVLTTPGCLRIPHCKEYFICKLRLLKSLQGALGGISVAIGDSDSDYCMFSGADIAIAYRPKTERVRNQADIIIEEFKEAIAYLKSKM